MRSMLCGIIDVGEVHTMHMEIPEAWTERLPFLESLNKDWGPLPRWGVGAWLAFYALFLFQLARGSGFLPMIDLVFIPIHEGGHLLFGYLGHALMTMGQEEEARSYWRRAIREKPELAQTYFEPPTVA